MPKRTREDSRSDSDASTTSASNSASSGGEARKTKSSHRKDKKEKGTKGKRRKSKDSKKKKAKEAKRQVKEAARFLKAAQKGGKAGDQATAPPVPSQIPPISPDDYFLKNPEFSAWLAEVKHTSFNALDSQESRKLFLDFVDAWNTGRLGGKYYAGMAGFAMRRSSHKWTIKKAGADGIAGASVGLSAAMEEDKEHRFAARTEARVAEKSEQRKWRAEQKEWLDEVLPKATGREAMIEKKAAAREANRARQESPDIVPGRHIDVMGTADDDSFAAAKAREAQRADWREKQQLAKKEQLQQRLAQAQQVEDEKMAALRSLVSQGPIQIRKRE